MDPLTFAQALTNLFKTIFSGFTVLWQYLTYPLFTLTIPDWLDRLADYFTLMNISLAGTYEINLLFLATAFIPIAILLKLISLIPFID